MYCPLFSLYPLEKGTQSLAHFLVLNREAEAVIAALRAHGVASRIAHGDRNISDRTAYEHAVKVGDARLVALILNWTHGQSW